MKYFYTENTGRQSEWLNNKCLIDKYFRGISLYYFPNPNELRLRFNGVKPSDDKNTSTFEKFDLKQVSEQMKALIIYDKETESALVNDKNLFIPWEEIVDCLKNNSLEIRILIGKINQYSKYSKYSNPLTLFTFKKEKNDILFISRPKTYFFVEDPYLILNRGENFLIDEISKWVPKENSTIIIVKNTDEENCEIKVEPDTGCTICCVPVKPRYVKSTENELKPKSRFHDRNIISSTFMLSYSNSFRKDVNLKNESQLFFVPLVNNDEILKMKLENLAKFLSLYSTLLTKKPKQYSTDDFENTQKILKQFAAVADFPSFCDELVKLIKVNVSQK